MIEAGTSKTSTIRRSRNQTTRNRRFYRVLTSVVIALVSLGGGAAAGYVIGVVVVIDATQHALRKYAVDRMTGADQYPAEAVEVLSRMNTSPYPRCSEEELDSFRRLLLKAHYLKDIGRMSGGRLACSATIRRADLPDTEFRPVLKGSDNSLIYTNIEPLRVDSMIPVVMRVGDSYAAFDPYPRGESPPTIQFTMTMRDGASMRSTYLLGSRFPISGNLLTKTSDGRDGSNLYATQCSDRYPPCMTACISIREALWEQRFEVGIWVAVGVLSGLCIGLPVMILYNRGKGIEKQLRRAIRRDGLHVVYQPLINLATSEVVGAEALVRWTDDDGLDISPQVFINIAEERGFANLITKFVVRRVLADFGRHLGEDVQFRINVNVAASDLADPEFLPMLDQALRYSNVSAENLAVEVTEGATVRHEAAIAAVCQLRSQGHTVYIDDFGTGYSSLAYLKDLSVDGIKIDKAFTQAIGTESVTVGILPQLLAMAEALRLSVVAEGIETELQAEYYRSTGLPLIAQGWLFGYPVPAEEFHHRWLQTRNALADETEVVAATQHQIS